MKKKAFTLIELIAAIAILSVLAVVIAPKVQGYKQMAKKSNFRSDAKIITNAVTAYNSDRTSELIKASDKFGDNFSNDALMKLITNHTEVTGSDVGKFKDFSIGQIKSISNGDFKVINDDIRALDGTTNIPTAPID